MGTIRREGLIESRNPQRLNVWCSPMILDAQWIVGFVDGEGCFFVGVNPHSEMTTGVQILPEMTIVQHRRDIQVLYALKEYFQCGVVRVNHGDRMCYRVRGFENLLLKVVPFFEVHSLKTKKQVDFQKFRDVLLMMGKGEHLTKDGVEKIKSIASSMNRGGAKIKSVTSGNVGG